MIFVLKPYIASKHGSINHKLTIDIANGFVLNDDFDLLSVGFAHENHRGSCTFSGRSSEQVHP